MIDLIISLFGLLGGIFVTLLGFDVIKLKSKTPEEEERMIAWKKKTTRLFKIGGIGLIVINIFLLIMFTI